MLRPNCVKISLGGRILLPQSKREWWAVFCTVVYFCYVGVVGRPRARRPSALQQIRGFGICPYEVMHRTKLLLAIAISVALRDKASFAILFKHKRLRQRSNSTETIQFLRTKTETILGQKRFILFWKELGRLIIICFLTLGDFHLITKFTPFYHWSTST